MVRSLLVPATRGLALLVVGLLGACALPMRQVSPGLSTELPPGVARVTGDCRGTIALTPTQVVDGGVYQASYPLVYHCDQKRFEVLPLAESLVEGQALRDLTLTEEGFYYNRYAFVDDVQVSQYFFFNRAKGTWWKLDRDDLDSHDLVWQDRQLTYLKAVPERDSASCSLYPLVNIEVHEEAADAQPVWRWTSKSKFFPEWDVADAQTTGGVAGSNLGSKSEGWGPALRKLRHCATVGAYRLFKMITPALILPKGNVPLLHFEQYDFIHPNSLQYINAEKDLLMSARHLDTIFIIERATGNVVWALGGQKNKATSNIPINDPGQGFSHQHSPYLVGKKLYVFDNGNAFSGRTSRVVVYDLDLDKSEKAVFKYEFAEPNGLHRPAMGYVKALDEGRIIVGWGGLAKRDMPNTQRAVSVINEETGKEEFALDFLPGWFSYRAKHSL